MVRTAVTVGRMAMARQDDLCLQVRGPDNGRVEVANFKPQEHAVSGREVGIADGTVMMLHIPAVQLKNQPAMRNEPLILRAAMVTLTTKETLIPATARFNIAHANQGLWTHTNFAAETLWLVNNLAGVCFPINVGCPVDAGPIHGFSRSEELSLNKNGKQTPMKTAQTILYVGLDVHKESIAGAIAGLDGSVRRYGEIPGHNQAVDKPIQKLQKPCRTR